MSKPGSSELVKLLSGGFPRWWFCVASGSSPQAAQAKGAQSHPPSPPHLPGDATMVPSVAAQVGTAQLQLLF